jgi:hypothetical protein
MTNISFSVIAAALILYISPLQAQVKDTYQDQANALTTIVVKEDSASDLDILQQQFDLDQIGMHQVIRITTRQEVAPKKEEVRIETPAMMEDRNMIAQAEPKTTANEAPVLTAPSAEQVEPAAEEVAEKTSATLPAAPKVEAVAQKSQRSGSSSSGYSTRNKSNQRQFKAFNKRFKKDKRKRVSKRDGRKARCYKF